jgi:pyruvate dehydrogenase E2 component (dihydrolipoamide acetyltransferase)
MPVEVILPKVDMDMATGKISRWFVEEGAAVKQGDVLFEIETDKAAMEIDAPASGILRDVTGKEGVDIPVGSPVAWIYAEGESAISPLAGEMSGRTEGGAVPLSPQIVEDNKVAQAGRSTPPPSALPDIFPARGEIGSGAVRATPLARRLARETGIDLSAIAGSGPRGRVTRADVEIANGAPPSALPGISPSRGEIGSSAAGAHLQRSEIGAGGGDRAIPLLEGEMPGRAEGGTPSAISDDATLRLFPEGSYELIPHDNMRKTIARRLVEAKSTIPHFYLTVDCELDALLSLRSQLNAAAPTKKTDKGEAPSYKLSVNDMIIKAMALALVAVPDANVSWTESAMVRHRHADVGVAVSIPGGLITPIIRKAEQKSLSAISNEMKDMAGRARSRKLKPEEYQGGTTAVSNLGMFGVKDFAAVINPPHATILAVGAGEQRAVVKDGAVKVATVMSVTLSTDHRAVDGALGAELLAAFRKLIENPMAMLV